MLRQLIPPYCGQRRGGLVVAKPCGTRQSDPPCCAASMFDCPKYGARIIKLVVFVTGFLDEATAAPSRAGERHSGRRSPAR